MNIGEILQLFLTILASPGGLGVLQGLSGKPDIKLADLHTEVQKLQPPKPPIGGDNGSHP